MLPCVLEWREKRTPLLEALLDSGSDGLVLPLGVAKFLGLRLKQEDKAMRVVGREVPRYSARVNLRIGRGGRFFTFPDVEAAIPIEGDTPILVGRKPLFESYKVTFIEPDLKFILDPY